MKVGLSGFHGFLANKLKERTEIEWVDGVDDIDYYIHMGSPTFTEEDIGSDESKVMHQYVKSSMKLIDDLSVPILFASSTGVDDIQLDHSGSTSYNLSKLFLENYIIHNCPKYTILRIGTIFSPHIEDVHSMKPDRIQPRLLRKEFKGIPFQDYYLNVDVFVDVTINAILNFNTGIVEFPLEQKRLTDLIVS